MNRRLEHVWEYLGEAVASALLLVASNQFVGLQRMTVWLAHQQSSLVNLLIVSAAATGITFGAFIAVLTTEFGLALRRTGEAKGYVTALGFPLLLFVSTLGVITLGNSELGWLYNQVAIFLLIYSGLNLVTTVRNVIKLVGLWQDVDRARHDGKRP
jgi:hypothetical protein